MKTKNIILWIILDTMIIFILIFIVAYPVLFQEENLMPILKGTISLNKKNDIIEISKEPRIYLSKTDKGSSPMTKLIEKEGWKLEEQFGAGYIYSKGDSKLIITSTQYTGKYTIWEFGMKD